MVSIGVGEGMRTYGYVVSSVPFNGAASSLPFVDSGGDLIKCNYAKIMVHYDYDNAGDARDHAVVWIEPSGPAGGTANSIVDDVNICHEYTMDDIAAGNVSGTYGQAIFAAVNTPGVAEFKCTNEEVMTSFNIRTEDHPKVGSHTGEVTIEVIYGNITPVNTLRQDRFDKGA